MTEAYPHLHVLLLADDYGADLWPLARVQAPACLASEEPGSPVTLLAAAAGRARDLTEQPIHVVTTSGLADMVAAELAAIGGLGATTKRRRNRRKALLAAGEGGPETGGADLIVVEAGRGSAFSIALAAACIRHDDPDAVIMVAPANQRVEVDDRWDSLVFRAYQVALRDRIALLACAEGLPPSGRGYLRSGKPFENIDGAFEVRQFFTGVSQTAVRRAMDEGALWYTGMFVARAAVICGAFAGGGESALGQHVKHVEGADRIAETAGFFAMLERDAWSRDEARGMVEALPVADIEEAALMPSGKLTVVGMSARVSMLASLDDLDSPMTPDRDGNRTQGLAVEVGSSNVTICAQREGRLVCTCGLEGVLVLDTDDVVLVADKRHLRDMGALREALAANGAPQLESAVRRNFPWGGSLLLASGESHAMLQLDMRPGGKLDAIEVAAAYGFDAKSARCTVVSGAVHADGAEDPGGPSGSDGSGGAGGSGGSGEFAAGSSLVLGAGGAQMTCLGGDPATVMVVAV